MFIAYAVDGAARMQALIQDLLELSRVQTQGATFHFTLPAADQGSTV